MADLEFVQRIVKDDKQAYNEFVDKYSQLIYSYIHCVIKQYHPDSSGIENINDIFQGLFVNLTLENFRKLKSFKAKNGSSLASWLRQVTINFTLDSIRKQKPILSLDEDNQQGLILKDIVLDGAANAIDKLRLEESMLGLKECIENLGREEKYFLKLHIGKSFSHQRMAEALRISRAAVDMRKSRIIAKLRSCFNEKGFELD